MIEYDFEIIPLTEEQQNAVAMGMVEMDSINGILKKIINKRAKDGWEPLYPFAFPSIWFRKAIKKNGKV